MIEREPGLRLVSCSAACGPRPGRSAIPRSEGTGSPFQAGRRIFFCGLSAPEGATQYVEGDLREPGPILATAARTIDFDQPVALLLIGILHLIQDSERPYEIVSDLLAALSPGSYLAISHPARDILPGQQEAQRRYNDWVSTPLRARLAARSGRSGAAGRGLGLRRRRSQALSQGPVRQPRARLAAVVVASIPLFPLCSARLVGGVFAEKTARARRW